MGKNIICRGCGTSYQKGLGASGKYCSMACKIRYPRNIKRCIPGCREHTVELRNVTFKNGVQHTQQFCRLCKVVTYLPRGSTQKEIILKAAEVRSKGLERIYSKSFHTSRKWQELRYKVFKKYGKICMCCNSSDGRMHVDHIKPRSKYPELALNMSNLQVLCEACNLGKSNKDETDWRTSK